MFADHGVIIGMAEPRKDIGMLQQRNRSQRDHVGGGLVAGLHHDHAGHGSGLMVELAGRDVLGGQAADHVVTRFALFAVHQLLDIDIHGSEGRRLLLVGRPGVQSDCGVLVEEPEVLGWHSQ